MDTAPDPSLIRSFATAWRAGHLRRDEFPLLVEAILDYLDHQDIQARQCRLLRDMEPRAATGTG